MPPTKARHNHLLLAIYVLLLVLTVFLLWRFGAKKDAGEQTIGFIMSTDSTGQGASVYEGVRAACDATGTRLLLRDNVPEGDGSCARAVAELVEQGAGMIVLSSPGYSLELEDAFADYPAVTFYGIFASATSSTVANLTSYSTRMYQARYLSGIVAGMYSKSGRIGFVATEPTSEVCRNINAFALGARRANPQAEVVVTWDLTDAGAAEDALALIRQEGVDVITYHQTGHTVVDVAERAGVASIGYYEQVPGVSDLCLTCAACDWSILYQQLIREYLRGQTSGKQVNEWLGLESDAVGLTGYSSLVGTDIRSEVELARREILSGYDVFINDIYDNQGVLRCGQGESMTDETLILKMDWLVEGVRVV